MHDSTSLSPSVSFTRDLQAHVSLCEEAMTLAWEENAALRSGPRYQPGDFDPQRKDLLPRLEQSLMALRKWRQYWQSHSRDHAGCAEFKTLVQSAQTVMMKLLLLDRENQQGLLRRGLLPATHLPAKPAQQPHCVADLYRRHLRG